MPRPYRGEWRRPGWHKAHQPGAAGGAAAAADGFVGGAVRGALAGVSDAGAVNGVAVTGAANGVAVAGLANGVAVTGAAAGVVALLGCVAGPGANGGVAVEGIGIAGLAWATGSCEVMTLALPGGGVAGFRPSSGPGPSCAARPLACGLRRPGYFVD